MNARELADKLGKHPNTIYKGIKNGEIKATRVGKSYEVDERVAHDMIVEQIYNKSDSVTNQVMSSLINELEEEKRRCFSEFLSYIYYIADKYMEVIDGLEDWELENMSNNPIVIETINKSIYEYERKIKEPWDKKPRTIREMLLDYENIVSAIEIIKENNFFVKCAEHRRNQFSKYDEIKKKLNKEELTIKEFNENIEL